MSIRTDRPNLFRLDQGASRDIETHGEFRRDEKRGFVGHVTIFEFSFGSADEGMLPYPAYLRERLWRIRTETGAYATICYPRLEQRNWTAPNALVVTFSFPYLLDDVAIDGDEAAINGFSIVDQIIPSLLDIRLVDYDPRTQGPVQYTLDGKSTWQGNRLSVELSASNWSSHGNQSGEIIFRSEPKLSVRFHKPCSVPEVLQEIRAFDDLLSVFAGRYVGLREIWLDVDVATEGDQPDRLFRLYGHGSGLEVADHVSRREMFAHCGLDRDWAKVFEAFGNLHSENKVVFKWYRTSQVHRRFLEEAFLYAARLIELYFRISPEPDEALERLFRTLRQRSSEEPELIELLDRRIAPIMFPKPAFVSTLRSLYARFPEIAPFTAVPTSRAASLRHRETHGSDTDHEVEDYGDMRDLTRGFLAAFRLAVLESLGFERDPLLASLRKGPYRNLFSNVQDMQ
jgi:hypothetical protein